jgi:hypothetical protein
MSRTEALREQNQALLKSLKRIGFQLRLGSDHNDAALYAELTEIARQLDQHLLDEEQAIYPALDRSKHVLVRQISKLCHRELGDLDHRVGAFLQRWPNGHGIAAEHDSFANGAAALVEALRRRLSDELTHLFPVADAS